MSGRLKNHLSLGSRNVPSKLVDQSNESSGVNVGNEFALAGQHHRMKANRGQRQSCPTLSE